MDGNRPHCQSSTLWMKGIRKWGLTNHNTCPLSPNVFKMNPRLCEISSVLFPAEVWNGGRQWRKVSASRGQGSNIGIHPHIEHPRPMGGPGRKGRRYRAPFVEPGNRRCKRLLSRWAYHEPTAGRSRSWVIPFQGMVFTPLLEASGGTIPPGSPPLYIIFRCRLPQRALPQDIRRPWPGPVRPRLPDIPRLRQNVGHSRKRTGRRWVGRSGRAPGHGRR